MRLSLGAPRTACRTARPRARQTRRRGRTSAVLNVRGPAAKRARSEADATPASASGAWWGEAMTRDSDDEDAARARFGRREFGAAPVAQPFSAARCARGRIAGDGARRCRLCEGDHERNRMVPRLPEQSPPLRAVRGSEGSSRRARSCPICKRTLRRPALRRARRRHRRVDASVPSPLPARHPESAAKGLGGGRNGKGNRDGNGTGRHRARARSRARSRSTPRTSPRAPRAPKRARTTRTRTSAVPKRRRVSAAASIAARGGGGTPPRDARGRRERLRWSAYADDGMENDAGGVRTRDAVQRKRHSERDGRRRPPLEESRRPR